jgi:phospholipase A-2-activating protein
MLNGKEFDYVFSIDIQENAPPLKLGYNSSQNPYDCAQEFVELHELPQSYLEQIAEFLVTNSRGSMGGDASLGAAGAASDPFTGAGRYIPGSGGNKYSGGGGDPFTGAGRYIPGSGGNSHSVGGNAGDPFTGAGRYIPGCGSRAILPVTEYSVLKAANFKAIFKKLMEINTTLEHSMVLLSDDLGLSACCCYCF